MRKKEFLSGRSGERGLSRATLLTSSVSEEIEERGVFVISSSVDSGSVAAESSRSGALAAWVCSVQASVRVE